MQSPEEILKRYWGHSSFRPLQQEIIDSVLLRRDTLALLPTGGGKSICYQLPALMLKGITIVVTPLIALMQEQVEKLLGKDIPAAYIYAGMHRSEVYRILSNAAEGAYKLLYISPERIQTSLFEEFLPVLNIQLIAVDEAHCISQWGHDFRPDYLKVNTLRQVFRNTPILAVTASATPMVESDIITQLQLKDTQVFRQSFERTNIQYSLAYSEQKNSEIVALLQEHTGSGIVYCRSRKQTEILAKQLQAHGINALPYHAGMQNEIRTNYRLLWTNNEVPVMVATTAFGMGIDKPDVRTVIHYDIPEHIEAYYQESGRAGRDGKSATSVLLYNHQDIYKLQVSTATQFPPYDFIRTVYQSVAEYLHIAIGTEPHKYYDFDLADFCKKFRLPAITTTRALKLLEQEGLWTLTESVFNPTTVHILADRHELDNIGRTYPDMHLLITTMLRLYGTLFYHPTAVNVKVIAKHLGVKAGIISQMLKRLHDTEVIQFNQPKEGPQLFFHHYRVDSRTLIINTERINALKKAHEERTNAMMQFITETHCRTKYMMHYFGQQYDKDCGHCDVCAAKTVQKVDIKELQKDILNILATGGTIHIADLAKILPAYNNQAVATTARQMMDDGILGLSSSNTVFIK